MTENDVQEERLSEYERAICYYTIPRVTRPLTYGLIIAYTGVLLATFLILAVGLNTEVPLWERWGTWAFGLTVVVGILGFVTLAIVNQVHERGALAQAESLPNVDSEFDDLPDPFEGHVLLRYPRHRAAEEVDIADNRGRTAYTVSRNRDGRHWEIFEPSGHSLVTVESPRSGGSFAFDLGVPRRLVVSRAGEETAVLRRRFNFGSSAVDISCSQPGAHDYVFRGGGFYRGEDLVGRIYFIRNYAYLDLRKTALNDGTLVLFAAMMS